MIQFSAVHFWMDNLVVTAVGHQRPSWYRQLQKQYFAADVVFDVVRLDAAILQQVR